ncbi:hypothetical protein BRADI_2g45630v3 [Brachypodium distachyon]|uniref:3'-5' exonuclease domain-containing protein n=2 Tax=Brachypodium distachyon TaxID=15368 RepID=A0A0Q3J9H2_BRADI|nr:hypothetical protein BRADI_2g45630v3 [Brachypodium distachyon]
MDDGTSIRTTVTNSGYLVECFLKEVQQRFHEEVQAAEPQDADVQHCLIVGLDTEWRQISHKGRRAKSFQIALLQLCVGDRCLVFQIFNADYVPHQLAEFLANPDHCFVAVGVGGDEQRLREDCGIEVAYTMDLPEVAADVLHRPKLRQSGLKTLAREVMGALIDKPKRVTLSDWSSEHLTWEQVRYACIDAFVSFDVGRRLLCNHGV